MRTIIILVFCLICAGLVQAQVGSSISADGTVPNDNAMLDVQSPSTGAGKGILIPRVTLAQRTTASADLAGGLLDNSGNLRGGAAQGLIVYQTDGSQGLYFNTSQTAAPAWSYLGDITGLLASNVWAAVGSTTNYLPRTGGTMSGALNMGAQIITNAIYYGDGRGLTNIDPAGAGFTESDPRWASASNAMVADIAGRLASNVWAAAGSTTNYLPQTGGTMSGALNMGAQNVSNVSHIDFAGSGVSLGRSADGAGAGAAMGNQANGSSGGAAMGYQANSYPYGVAIGYQATGSVAVGYQANGSVAVGYQANGYNSGVAVGRWANGSEYGVAMGYQANSYPYGVAIGYQATGAWYGAAVGYLAIGTNYGVAMGDYANGSDYGVAIGSSATGNLYGVAVGYQANGYDSGAAVGYMVNGYSHGAAIGREANGRSSGAAVGQSANGYSGGAAVGISANGSSEGAVVGLSANGYYRGVAMGREANGSDYGVAVGYLAIGTNYGAAMGNEANGSSYGAAVGSDANGNIYGAAMGYQANGYSFGAAAGWLANGSGSGVAVGETAYGTNFGVAVGYMADGSDYGAALGRFADGSDYGVALGRSANGTQTNVAIGARANAQAGTERIAIGHNVTNNIDNTARIHGHLYLDGGTGMWYRAAFGEGTWTAKAFEIDHPLDPENKILRHFCLEGPEVWNVYAGNAQLVNGQAVVELPDYYSALNLVGSEIYSLTPVGGRADTWVQEEVRDNCFLIQGEKNIKVSWTIKVLRNDPGCLEDLRRRPAEQLKNEIR